MPLSIALTVGTTGSGTGNGPFPPTYPGLANGFVDATATPLGVVTGAASPSAFFGGTVIAVANDEANTQFTFAMLGTYDQTYIGPITYTDGSTIFNPTQAGFVQTLLNGQTVSQWIWQMPAGTPALITGTLVVADSADQFITFVGESPSSTVIELSWSNALITLPASYKLYRGVAGVSPTLYQTLAASATSYDDIDLTASTQYTYYLVATYADGTVATSITLNLFTPASGISNTFNCDCEPLPSLPSARTLADLRKSVLIRSGYAAQAANPPPGMVLLVNEFLQDAQRQLYRQHDEFHTKRMYAWQMQINQRYYGIDQDESGCRVLDPLNIEWVGFEDLNQAWYQLIAGINPLLYTRAQISTGWPTHYEIRSCIEIFPAPKANYTLWIKGHFGLDPFVADTDYTTIDSEAIFLLALAMTKAHYGQADAQAIFTQADNYTKYLVAKQHGTKRYVPRTYVETAMTPPLFLPTVQGGP